MGAVPTLQHYFPLDVRGDGNNTYVARFKNIGGETYSNGIQVLAGTDSATNGTKYLACYERDCSEYLGGVVQKNGQCQFESASDARRKEDITPSTMNGLAVVKGVPVSNFRYIGYQGFCTGFIAQDMESVYPEATGLHEEVEIVKHHTPVTLKAGSVYRGKVLTRDRVVDQITTETVINGSCKTLRPLSLIPVLWKAVQEMEAEKTELAATVTADASRIAVLETAVQERASVVDPAALQEALKDWTPDQETVDRIADAVLKDLGVDPWVEIAFAAAWEEVAEMTPVGTPQTVTKYRINWETMATEAYTVEETVTEQQPTGRTVKQLKPNVRFDEKANKFYRRLALDDPALQAALPRVKALAERAAREILAASAARKALGRQAMARVISVVPVPITQEKPSKDRASLQEEGKVALAAR